ncbi:hypothetical protein LQW54_008392 [Pestalotiopsis sp. IQ-011]
MLAGKTSPQPEDLATLPWTSRNNTGVYATILEGGTFHAPSPGFSVQLASVAQAGGLREQWAWAKDPKRRTGSVFWEDRHLGKTEMKAKRRLVELFVTKALPKGNATDEAEARRLVKFAEAIITAWLGAPSWMTTTCSRSVLDLSPWNPPTEREHHPLAEFVRLKTTKKNLPPKTDESVASSEQKSQLEPSNGIMSPETDKPMASIKRGDPFESSKDDLFHETDKSVAPNRASKMRHSRLSQKTNKSLA